MELFDNAHASDLPPAASPRAMAPLIHATTPDRRHLRLFNTFKGNRPLTVILEGHRRSARISNVVVDTLTRLR